MHDYSFGAPVVTSGLQWLHVYTYNPMGGILNSCDRNLGHTDPSPCMLVDPK